MRAAPQSNVCLCKDGFRRQVSATGACVWTVCCSISPGCGTQDIQTTPMHCLMLNWLSFCLAGTKMNMFHLNKLVCTTIILPCKKIMCLWSIVRCGSHHSAICSFCPVPTSLSVRPERSLAQAALISKLAMVQHLHFTIENPWPKRVGSPHALAQIHAEDAKQLTLLSDTCCC